VHSLYWWKCAINRCSLLGTACSYSLHAFPLSGFVHKISGLTESYFHGSLKNILKPFLTYPYLAWRWWSSACILLCLQIMYYLNCMHHGLEAASSGEDGRKPKLSVLDGQYIMWYIKRHHKTSRDQHQTCPAFLAAIHWPSSPVLISTSIAQVKLNWTKKVRGPPIWIQQN